MKIKITKTCECVYLSSNYSFSEDTTLYQDLVFEGKLKQVVNWQGTPLPATDLNTSYGTYCGIPNDCFEQISE